jgi:hypothetical protein
VTFKPSDEFAASAMEANSGCVSGAAEDDGDLTGVELFPVGKAEDLSVVFWQLLEGGLELLGEPPFRWAGIRLRAFDSQTVMKGVTAFLPTALICKDPSSNAVEPKTLFRSAWDLIQAAPCSQKGFCDDVIGVDPDACPPSRIAKYLVEVLLVQRLKAPPMLGCIRRHA